MNAYELAAALKAQRVNAQRAVVTQPVVVTPVVTQRQIDDKVLAASIDLFEARYLKPRTADRHMGSRAAYMREWRAKQKAKHGQP